MNDLIETERLSLESIREGNVKGMGGPAFSPLENIDGTNSVVNSIYTLKDSPICWPGVLSVHDNQQADQMLESLHELYEQAVQPWEQFRALHPPLPYMLVLATNEADQDVKALPIYGRWPNGTFPANIQREARNCYWLLKSTSRFSVESTPNKWSLNRLCLEIEPLKFKHVAGMAAIVCITSALHQYTSTLLEWAYVVQKKIPGHSFEWLVQHKPALLEAILAEYISSSANGHDPERALRVAARWRCAEDWLELVNSEEDHQFEIKQISDKATQQAVSSNARKAASSKHAIPRAWVISEWEKRKDKGQSKTSFGKQFSLLVKNKFDLNISSETIYRDWLPKI